MTAALLTPADRLGIVVGAAVVVASAVLIVVTARRSGGGAGGADGSVAGITRRQLVERGVLGLMVASVVGVAVSAVDYVATTLSSARGRRYRTAAPAELRARSDGAGPPYYDAVGGFYVVAYPAAALPAARRAYAGAELTGMESGFVAVDQTCTHLGCAVKWCATSRWFECPCHGSRFNAVGEQRRGPAPRGLDRFAVSVVDGTVVVDTATKILGPPPGTDTTGQPAAGPHCN